MKIIITILTIILSITLVSAITIYAGECNSIEFPNTDPINWSVEGNSSNMDGFSYEKNGTTITYCFHKLYKPDNFTLTFYNYQEVIVKEKPPTHYSFGRGSSSSTKTDKDINITDETNKTKINDTETEIIDTEIEKKNYIWRIIGIGILLLVVLISVWLVNKKKKKEK